MIKTRGFILFFLIANLYFLASNVFLLTQIRKAVPDSVYTLSHNTSIYDYNMYLSAITQGQHNDWLFRDPYTSESVKPSIFYIFYVLAGKILPFWPPVTYHIIRIISIELFFIAIYKFCWEILSKNRLLVFWGSLFSILGTVSPSLISRLGDTNFSNWWTSFDAVKRLDIPPHNYLGFGLLLYSLSFIFIYLRSHKSFFLILSLITIFFGGIINPSILIPIVVGIPLAYFISIITRIITNKCPLLNLTELQTLITLLLTGLLCYFINLMQTKSDTLSALFLSWPLKQWNSATPNFNIALMQLFGILPLISLPAVIFAVRKNNFEFLLLAVWAWLPFLLLPLATPFSIAKIRLVSEAPYVPWGILTAITIFNISKRKQIRVFLTVLVLIAAIPVSIYLFVPYSRQAFAFPSYTNFFIPEDMYKAVEFFQKKTPKNSVVLSNETFGNIVPAFSPTISYFGHVSMTLNFSGKQDNVWHFYTGRMKENEALDFLRENKISYAYYGSEEKSLGGTPYSFLKPVYQTGDITIFTPRVK
jgi:hypothetical protein